MNHWCRTLAFNFFIWALILSPTQAAERPDLVEGVGIQEALGKTIDFQSPQGELQFKNEKGEIVPLSSYFHQRKPVLLSLVYYECPMLCSLVLNGLLESIKNLDWKIGDQYEMVTLSINPNDTPALASQKKKNYLSRYAHPGSERGWHFLTGDETSIRQVASQIGFEYRYDAKEKQYIHAAAIFILTPEGKISRYLYGTQFKPQDVKFALLEASQGKVVPSALDRVLLFCFHFDPSKNSYTLSVWRIVQVVLTIQALALAGLMALLWRRERKS